MVSLVEEKKRKDYFTSLRQGMKTTRSKATNELIEKISLTPKVTEGSSRSTDRDDFDVSFTGDKTPLKLTTSIGFVIVHRQTYDRLLTLYSLHNTKLLTDKNEKDFYRRTFLLIYRYSYIDPGLDRQAYMAPRYFEAIRNTFGRLDLEAFAAAFNATVPKFCSLFKDVEEPFGSVGNFLTYKLSDEDRVVQVNPPMIGNLNSLAVKKCVEVLQKDKVKRVFVFLTAPNWLDITEKLNSSGFVVWQNKPEGKQIKYIKACCDESYMWRMPLV